MKSVIKEVETSEELKNLWQLPEGWKWKRLDDICKINPRKSKIIRCPEALTSFLPMSGVDEVEGVISKLEIRPYKDVDRGFTYFEEGDILFGKITPSMENGKCAIARYLIDKIGFGSTEFHVLRPQSDVTAEWIHKFLRRLSFRLEAKKYFRGAVGQQRVPAAFLESFLIPVPPSSDIEHYILGRIQELLAEVKQSRKLIKQMYRDAAQIMNAALEEVFTKISSNIHSEQLAHHILHLTSGSRNWSNYASPNNQGSLFIRAGNVSFSRLDLSAIQRLNLPSNIGEERAKVSPGDLLVTITGAKIGQCCVVPDNLEEAYVNQHVALVRLKESLDPRYLMWFILSPSGGVRQTTAMQYGQTKPGLNLTNIRNMSLPIPEKCEQRQIVSYLDSVQFEVDKMLKLLAQDAKIIDQLEQSILEQAFQGKL